MNELTLPHTPVIVKQSDRFKKIEYRGVQITLTRKNKYANRFRFDYKGLEVEATTTHGSEITRDRVFQNPKPALDGMLNLFFKIEPYIEVVPAEGKNAREEVGAQ